MSHRIVCYGDSNTFGYDPRSYFGGRYPETVRWTALLKKQGWEIINEGENGRSIPRQEWETEQLLRRIRAHKAEAAVIMLGSNDLLQDPGLSAEECAGRMERFLRMLQTGPGRPEEENFGIRLLLVSPPPMRRGAWVGSEQTLRTSSRLAGAYQEVSIRLGVPFADAGAWDVDLAYDGVHFSPEGHAAFARGMNLRLAALFTG